MQTFLPYADFKWSAQALDYRRLGKQRVEAYQILRALRGESKGWRNHPATKMWAGYESALASYGVEVCAEWISRGYKDSLLPYFAGIVADAGDIAMPHWLGSAELHESHRANLLRKDLEFYSRLGWTEDPELPYVWPA